MCHGGVNPQCGVSHAGPKDGLASIQVLVRRLSPRKPLLSCPTFHSFFTSDPSLPLVEQAVIILDWMHLYGPVLCQRLGWCNPEVPNPISVKPRSRESQDRARGATEPIQSLAHDHAIDEGFSECGRRCDLRKVVCHQRCIAEVHHHR